MGWAIKPGLLGPGRSQGLRTGAGMMSVLLGWVLALLWVSAAQAEVLVQPDFDAKKVQEPWCVLRVGLGAEPLLETTTRG